MFTTDPQSLVLNRRIEVGSVDPMVLTRRVDGPRVLTLAGRSWLVRDTDWRRHRVFVEHSTLPGSARWAGSSQPLSYALTDAMRRVLLDGNCGSARLSARATTALARVRQQHGRLVGGGSNVITGDSGRGRRLWTWAGARANSVIAAALHDSDPSVVEPGVRLLKRPAPAWPHEV